MEDFLIEDFGATLGDRVLELPFKTTKINSIDYKEIFSLSSKDTGSLFNFAESNLNPLQQLYIVGHALHGTRKGGCLSAGVSYNTVSLWMEDKAFKDMLQVAIDIVRDSLEEELFRRAMNGSDKLLIEAVKAAKPEKYNKKQADFNVNGNMVHTWADLARQAVGTDLEEE